MGGGPPGERGGVSEASRGWPSGVQGSPRDPGPRMGPLAFLQAG